jgi:tetratricopeptide (TPR) repeat protein
MVSRNHVPCDVADEVAGGVHSQFFGAEMSDETLKAVVIPCTNPAEAYAADLQRLQRTAPLGLCDDAWLVLSHALSRLGDLASSAFDETVPAAADALAASAMAAGAATDSGLMRAASALRGLLLDGATHASRTSLAELVAATQAVAEEQERAGAFALAYATLHGLLRTIRERSTESLPGGVLAQMGRAARQLGALDVAREHYDETMLVGYDCQAFDIVARAFLGLGVLSVMRGNFPMARDQFDRSLTSAERANDPDLIRSSHHGLLNVCMQTGDLDAALVHGWNVLRLCLEPESRAEALMNMGEICRLTGEHTAAMRTYAVAMEWTSHRGVRVHAMSGALESAVALQRIPDAKRYVDELSEELPKVPDIFTRAAIGVDLAGSLHRMGELDAAASALASAQNLAAVNAFHEVVHRAEQLASTWGADAQPTAAALKEQRNRRPHRSEHFRTVLRSLNGLTAATL